MKKILLFSGLLALGFAGGSIMPQVFADTDEEKNEQQSCNCGCGPSQTASTDLLLMAGLMEAFAMDNDGSLSKEELVAVMENVQDEYQTVDISTVLGTDSKSNANSKVSSYEKYISRIIESSKAEKTSVVEQPKQETIVKQSGTTQTNTPEQQTVQTTVKQSGTTQTNTPKQQTVETTVKQSGSSSSVSENKGTVQSKQSKKVKNNNGLGNGSEPADESSVDIKGTDPSNPGKGKKSSEQTSTSSVSKKATITKSTEAPKQQKEPKAKKQKSQKEKNNNGLGNGSEPADGTSTDIKGVDPSNPGKGSSNNKAGK